MADRPTIIAVDFDGCLCENAWPGIGNARQGIIDALLMRQKQGAKIILWTCRVEDKLTEAVNWCADRGLSFDAVNANLPLNIAAFGNDCRKVFADEYWDDKAVLPEPYFLISPDGERSELRAPGVSIPPDAEHGHDEAQATRKNRMEYLGQGMWRCGNDLFQAGGEYRTISSIAELREYERQEKADRREVVRIQRERLRGYVPTMRDLIETHHKCKACPFHIQKVEMWKRPFQSALSIFRSWKWDRGFRKRTIDGLASLEKKNAEQAPK